MLTQIHNRLMKLNGKRNIPGIMGFLGYEYLGIIGKGRFGICHKVQKEGSFYILKIFNENDYKRRRKKLFKEIRIIKDLHHETIPKYVETVYLDGVLGYIMEEKKGFTLETLIDEFGYDFSKKEIITILSTLIDTLEFLHLKNLYHNDIKITNILYDKKGTPPVALLDFGSAKSVGDRNMDFRGIGNVFLDIASTSSEILPLNEKNSLQGTKLTLREKAFIKRLLFIKKPYLDIFTVKKDFKELFLNK